MAPPKRPWFRFYVEAVHDRKLRRQKPEVRWLFVACLAAARQSPVPGRLLVTEHEAMTLDDLADFAGMGRRQVEAGMKSLHAVGVVALDGGGWIVPAFCGRQYESDDVTARTRKHRSNRAEGTTMERSMPVPGNDDGTHQRTETETETEQNPPNPPSKSLALVPPSASPPATDAVQAIFDAWVQATNRTGRTVLTGERRRLIAKQLKHYPIEDLLDAVRGWRHSSHHRGENDRSTTYNDLELILRDAKHIEMFRDLERDPPARPVPKGMQGITAWLARTGS